MRAAGAGGGAALGAGGRAAAEGCGRRAARLLCHPAGPASTLSSATCIAASAPPCRPLAQQCAPGKAVHVAAGVRGSSCGAGLQAGSCSAASGEEDTPVRAVLFDMDGVLCDSEDRSRQAAVELFQEMGVAVTQEDFIPFMGTGEANFLGGVARAKGVAGFDPAEAKSRFFEIYISKYAVPNSGLGYPGALELIQQCRAAGLRTAVASSADRIKVDANLAAAGLPQTNFDAIVSADLFERLKPAPDIFLAAARQLGLLPEECVVIEDALAGVQAAAAAGMRCIAVSTTLSGQALAAAAPTAVRTDISAISLTDIQSLRYPSTPGGPPGTGGAAAQGAVADKREAAEEGGWVEQLRQTLQEPLALPGGFETQRREVLKLASLAGLFASSYVLLSRAKAGILLYSLRLWPYAAKAMSYTSPRALFNAVLGTQSPLATPRGAASAGEDRVRQFKKYIADLEKRKGGLEVPDFRSGLEWLNTAPLRISKELQGRVVVLDFWTYCCINCMHVLPDLAFLERKYKEKAVTVVGVHSAKFDNEKDTAAIREAVLRYNIEHPVVNDGEMSMWRALGVSAWPTLAIVSPRGRLLALLPGEGHRQDVDELLTAALEYYGEQGQLDARPLPLALEREKGRRAASTLKFPGKLASCLPANRLFIADSSNHRIVVTDLEGKFILQVGGGGGEGLRDGAFDYAAFNRPQGVGYHAGRNLLFVADTENHALREVDLGKGVVRTLAGNGTQGGDYRGGGKGPSQVLNSPWDVLVDEGANCVYVAMAGQHQIWKYDLSLETIAQFSGDGYERNLNGKSGGNTSWAQPSGLSMKYGGGEIYVADSESSSIRAVDTATGGSRSCAGGDPYFADNLFQFGDRDGTGSNVRLQHPLAVLAMEDGRVLVADSYNHKVKLLDPVRGEVVNVAGSGKAGYKDGSGLQAQLSEPGGLALGPNGTVYVADTNNSVVRVMDPAAGYTLSTLPLSSVPPPPDAPAAARRRQKRLLDAQIVRISEVGAASGKVILRITLPEGYHYTKGAVSKYEVDNEGAEAVVMEPLAGNLDTSGRQPAARLTFRRSSQAAATVKVNCKVYYCQADDVCLYKAVTFEIPFVPPSDKTEQDDIIGIDYTLVPQDLIVTSFPTS